MRLLTLLAVILLFLTGFAAGKEANCILLFDREEVTVNADGTFTTRDECRYQILNYEGLTRMRELAFHFNSAYGTVQVTHLAIVKPDGRKITIDPAKHSSVNTESSQLTSAIFDPAQRVLTLTVPGLEIGDTLEVTSLEKITKPRMPGEFSDISVLQADFPIKYYEYIINMPMEKPLKSICIKDEVKNTVTFSKTHSGKRIIYRWIARDVPQAVPESAMPQMYTCIQRVLTSTVESWEEISRWYDRLCEPHLAKVNDEMRKKTAGLTAGKKSDMEKITALFQFVSQQIRYTGITNEKDAPGYEPHDVDQTFDRRHGVCRDKAALLVAMLRLAGFKAYPILFMSGTPKDKEVPNIYFNHAITGVETAPGKYILMDPTFETTAELFPGYLAGDQYLAAKPEGDTLRTAAPVKAESNLLEITTTVSAREKPLSFRTILNFSGIYDQMYRDAFSNWQKDEIQNFFAGRVKTIFPDAELKNIRITPENIRDMSKPLSVTLSYQGGELFPEDAAPAILPLPRGAFLFGLMDSLFANTALESRKFPLKALPRAVREKITVEGDTAAYQITMPETAEIREEGLFRVKSDSSVTANGITESFFFAIDSMLIAPGDYAKFKAAAGKAKNLAGILPVIRKKSAYTTDGANCEILKKSLHINLEDHNRWKETHTFSKKILNYAGMKEESNLEISYIDGVEKVDVSAEVISPQGKKFILSANEINRMDRQFSAGAPRYRKRKLAVISFPGVTIGSIINCKVVIERNDQKFFYTEMLTSGNTPVKYSELIVEHPAKMALKISPVPEKINHSSTMGGKRIIRRCILENAPRRAVEPGEPDDDLFIPALKISSGDYDLFYRQIVRHAEAKAREVSPEIAGLAKKIAATAPDIHPAGMGAEGEARCGKEEMRRLSIAYALENYINKHIREVPLPLSGMLFSEYSLPQTTLRDTYGNNVDRAILLASMLKVLGIKYEFAVIASTPAYPEKLDMLRLYPENIFSRLLIFLPETGSYLNDSGLYTPHGVIRNHGAVELDKNGKLSALRPPGNETGTDIRCTVDLASDLSAVVTLEYSYTGRNLEKIRERFARFTPPLKKQYFEKLAAGISPQAKIIHSAVTADNEIVLKLQIPQFARRTGKFVSFPIPEYDRILKAAALPAKERQFPYAVNKGESAGLELAVTVPANYTLFPPKGIEFFALEGVSWQKYFLRSGDKYLFEMRLNMNREILSPDEFSQLLKLNKNLNQINMKNILFITE